MDKQQTVNQTSRISDMTTQLPLTPYATAIEEIRRSLAAGTLAAVARVNSPHTEMAIEAWLERHGSELGTRELYVLVMSSTLRQPPHIAEATVEYFGQFP